MIWARATVFSRLLCLLLAAGSFGLARHLTQPGPSGAASSTAAQCWGWGCRLEWTLAAPICGY